MKGSHLETFQNIHNLVPHDVAPAAPTKGCFKVEPSELYQVNCKLLDSGVATLIPEDMALKDADGKVITGGLFAVDHKESSDRIILDRRPYNELERRLVWAKLPHGSLLTQIIVPPGYSIRGSGDDLSNYFYLLRHKDEWLPRNAIGKVFDGKGYEKYGGAPGQRYLLAFRVIAMGDLNAVDIAQQVHLEILREASCMDPQDVLEFRSPVPATHTFEGLYIDDHIVTQVLPSKKYRSPGAHYKDESIMENSRNHYHNLGIPTSDKKAFSKSDRYVAWGTEIDSKSGRVGTPQHKLRHLAELISATCKLKLVSKKLLQGLTGLLVHPFLHKRIAMSILQDTFAWIQRLKDGESKPLPIAVKEELLGCGLILPLVHSNIRWEVSRRVGASDASLSHGGRAATEVSVPIAQTLYRYAEHRGEHVRLDWQRGAVAPESSMRRAPPELEALLGDLPWNQTETCSFAHKQHINILEARMIHHELRDLVMSSPKPLRSVLLVDSRAAAGAWAKGRSSSRNLNRIIRQSLGWSLAGRKSLHLVWVRSECNPADYPSRSKRIPDPPTEASAVTKEAFGDQCEDYRVRRSNRDIWRQVNLPSDVPGPNGAHAVGAPAQADTAGAPLETKSKNSTQNGAADHPAARHWSFREIFAGTAHLSSVFRRRGKFRVDSPFELMQRGKADPNNDILNDKVFEKLCREASRPRQYWHFGLPCGSFSLLQNLNKGTRARKQPLGDGTVKREVLGNEIMHRTTHLCQLLHNNGSFFTIENPLSSYAWKTPAMVSLASQCAAQWVKFDQCQYGLKIPLTPYEMGLALKPTMMMGTLPHLDRLHRRCCRVHQHVAVIGGVRYQGKWRKRSELAGSYPSQLCHSIAKIFEQSFA